MSKKLAQSMQADPVSRLRLRPVCSVQVVDSIRSVLGQMTAKKTGCALVMNADQLVGIFTERDFVSRIVAERRDPDQTKVEQVMTQSPKTLRNTDNVKTAIELMEGGGYRHIPVLGESGQPVGVLSVKNVVQYLVEYFPANVYNLPPTPEQIMPAREGA